MSAAEFTDWLAYYQLEPWGAWRDNWHAAQIAKLVYDANRGKHPTVKLSAFMYEDAERKAKNAARTFIANLESLRQRNRNG